jgi:hypothetical protein
LPIAASAGARDWIFTAARLAPKHIDLVDRAAFQRRPLCGPFVERLVFTESRIALDRELIILQRKLRLSRAPVTEDERIVVVVRSMVASFAAVSNSRDASAVVAILKYAQPARLCMGHYP